jgi:hypothetical protein
MLQTIRAGSKGNADGHFSSKINFFCRQQLSGFMAEYEDTKGGKAETIVGEHLTEL